MSCQQKTDFGAAHEQRSFKSSRSDERPTSHAKQCLLFPKLHGNALLQSPVWQPRGKNDRIQIILSEGLVNEDDTLDGDCWDIVCFAFQYAPRGMVLDSNPRDIVLTQCRAVGGGWYCVPDHRPIEITHRRASHIHITVRPKEHNGSRVTTRGPNSL